MRIGYIWKSVSSVEEKIKKMSIINYRALLLHFGTSGKNCNQSCNFRVSLDEKTKHNLKLLKDAILEINPF